MLVLFAALHCYSLTAGRRERHIMGHGAEELCHGCACGQLLRLAIDCRSCVCTIFTTIMWAAGVFGVTHLTDDRKQ